MSRPLWSLLFLLPALLVLAPAHAEVYRWVDDDGVTHYSAYPPPDSDAELIDMESGIAAEPEPPPAADDDPDESTQADAGDDEPRTVEEFCERVREQLAIVESDREVRVETAGGELEPLQGEAREQRREALRQQIAQHC